MKLAFFLLFVLLCSVGASADSIHLMTGTFDPLLDAPFIPQNLKGEIPLTGKEYFLVQFKSFPELSWIQELSSRATFFEYYPDNTYLIGANASDLGTIRSHPSVRWVGLYQPFFKLSPEIGKPRLFWKRRRNDGNYYLDVELFPDADVSATVAAIERIGGTSIGVFEHSNFSRVKVWLPYAALSDLAKIPTVAWVEEEPHRTLRNNVTRWVIQSNIVNQTPIWAKGIHGEGQIIGHIDGLISTSAANPVSCYFQSSNKIVKIHNLRGSSEGIDSHGGHTAGTAAGDSPPFGSASSSDHDGIAFAARIAHTSLCDLEAGECDDPNANGSLIDLFGALINDHNDGARIHTNSWGDDDHNSYTTDCRDIDKFSRNNEDDLVIFAATNQPKLTTPENAKNVLAVGATKHPPNEGIRYSGGSGPTSDGRRKPEIFAPGESIVSCKTNSSCGTSTQSGTSMAAPAIAGAAALVRQYYMEGWYPTGSKNASNGFNPTGALVKATLLNGTVEMTGTPTGYPNNSEGWGRLLLDNSLYFSGESNSRILFVDDVRNGNGFSGAGVKTYNLAINSNAQPLKVTLVWTDPPSAVNQSGDLLINNLNLEVTLGDGTFFGNSFSNGESATGGTTDNKNNVEQVVVKSPDVGCLTIKVLAASIVPPNKQGYALVVSGDIGEGAPAPATPTNFTVFPGTNENSLTWDPVAGATYIINRNSVGCGSSSFQFRASTPSTNFLDTGLSGATTYGYQVIAQVGGCQSAPSSCADGTPGGQSFLFSDSFGDGSADDDWDITGNGTGDVNGNNQLALTGEGKVTANPTFYRLRRLRPFIRHDR